MPLLNKLGSSVLVLGSAALAHAQQELATLSGVNAGDQLGYALAFVGDVDNDGHEDFAVGAPGANASAGYVKIFSGQTMAELYTWNGTASDERYGSSLAGAGDLDGDGHDDVIVGAPHRVVWLSGTGIGGYIEFRSGATGAVLHTLVGPSNSYSFGAAVAGGSDIDGDAIPDVVVGAPGGPGAYGAAYVVSGASAAIVRTHVPAGPMPPFSSGPTLGWAVAFIGDFDGDGRAEYAVGAPASLSLQPSYVQLFDGATGDALWRTAIDQEDEEFGWSLAPLGDVTGDGRPDLVAGARQGGSFGPGFGRVRVLDGVSGAIVASYGQGLGAAMHAGLGFAVTAVGDLDGDGKAEFASGCPSQEPFPPLGYAARPTRAWSIGAMSAVVVIPVAGDANDAFGHALASGDANGDGLRDLLIGEPFDDDTGAESGSIHLYTFVRTPTTYCAAQVNSQGCTPFIGSVGSPSASSFLGFDVTAGNVLNNASGILFYGYAPNNSPHLGGTLCVRQPVRRTPVQNSGGSSGAPDCSGTFSFDFQAWIQSGFDPALGAGDEVFAQYWSRDSSFLSTTNLTDALAFYVSP